MEMILAGWLGVSYLCKVASLAHQRCGRHHPTASSRSQGSEQAKVQKKIEKEEEEFLNSVVWEAGWEDLGEGNAFQVDGTAVAKALRQNWPWHV